MRDMVNAPLRTVWTQAGLPPDDLERIELSSNPEPSIDSVFKLATAAQTSVGLAGLAASHYHHLNLPEEVTNSEDYYPQGVRVDSKHAVIEFFGERYYAVDGKVLPTWLDDPLSDLYPTRDGSFVRLGCNFPHHKEGMLELLGVPDGDKAKVAAALLKVDANAFADHAQSLELCAAALHDFKSIDSTAQGQSTMNLSPVTIRRIEGVPHAPPRRTQATVDSRPLDGIRMVDMTRLLSAPLAGRTMAMHGADVIYVTAPHLVATPEYDRFTSMGKRTAQLDINKPGERAQLVELLRETDVFVNSYRPGSLLTKGLGPREVAKLRGRNAPGLVYASMGTFSSGSPCWFRKGFARDIELMCGHVCEEANGYKEWMEMCGEDTSALPKWRNTPICAIAHLAGLFLSFGIIAALCKTAKEGGSYEVHVSLESVALWLRHLGTLSPEEAFDEEDKDMPYLPPRYRDPEDAPRPDGLEVDDRIADLMVTVDVDQGDQDKSNGTEKPNHKKMSFVRHAAELERTPVQYGKAPAGLNAHKPKWLPRSGDRGAQETPELGKGVTQGTHAAGNGVAQITRPTGNGVAQTTHAISNGVTQAAQAVGNGVAYTTQAVAGLKL